MAREGERRSLNREMRRKNGQIEGPVTVYSWIFLSLGYSGVGSPAGLAVQACIPSWTLGLPQCEFFLAPEQINAGEMFYPLHVNICSQCWLAQIGEFVAPDQIFSETLISPRIRRRGSSMPERSRIRRWSASGWAEELCP